MMKMKMNSVLMNTDEVVPIWSESRKKYYVTKRGYQIKR